MLDVERHTIILDKIKNSGSVKVDELSAELSVSAMTIRRDLQKLEKDGELIRCHGGAVSRKEVPYRTKKTKNHNAKVSIAQKAAGYIREGMTIYLDAGTTTYLIAKAIVNMKELTVVTNDLEIAMLLRTGKCDLIMCGGSIQKSTGSIFGCYSAQMMRGFRFDIGFFGAAVVNDNMEVMTPTIDKGFLKKLVSEECSASYLVIDQSKFGLDGMNMINTLADYTGVITDKVFTEKEKRKIKNDKINIIEV